MSRLNFFGLLLDWIIATFSGTALATEQNMDGDPQIGETVYQQCIACHSPSYNRVGPLHCGLLGRSAGSVSNFPYSQVMNNADFIWDEDTLNAFLKSPTAYLPGTTMSYYGVKDDTERNNLIAYLSSLTSSSEECQ